jgi:hypothetical protein
MFNVGGLDMAKVSKAIDVFEKWYKGLKVHKSSGGPARGSIAAALVVLDHLKEDFNLQLLAHRAAGTGQIKGVSGAAVRKILARFGEHRQFAKEAGRTNRGAAGDIGTMLAAISSLDLQRLSPEDRNNILTSFQRHLVEKVRNFHERRRLSITFDQSKSAWQTINDLLVIANENSKSAPVAQHLIGAKLQLRYPDITLGNQSYTTADDQLGRAGDFQVENTVFHVTISPTHGVYEKCRSNLAAGLRVYLLVPDEVLAAARQMANIEAKGQISVGSIESFVSQNIDEISRFSQNQFLTEFRRLLELYNQRVDEVEIDKSLLIEIPPNLV